MAHGIIPNNRRGGIDADVSEPYREYMYLVCGEAITKGNTVRWAVAGDGTAPYVITARSTDTTHVTHKKWGGVLVMKGDADTLCVGIATETGAIGDVIRVQTRGRGDVDIVTGGSMAANTVGYMTSTAGATAEVAGGSTTDADMLLSMATYGLDADDSTAGYANTYLVITMGGW